MSDTHEHFEHFSDFPVQPDRNPPDFREGDFELLMSDEWAPEEHLEVCDFLEWFTATPEDVTPLKKQVAPSTLYGPDWQKYPDWHVPLPTRLFTWWQGARREWGKQQQRDEDLHICHEHLN